MIETFRNAWKIDDLRKKITFTLMILVIFRIGSVIPAPFVSSEALKAMMSQGGSLLGYIDILSGGAFAQSTIFALSISPYITASIVIQLMTIVIPYLERLAKEGEEGKKQLNKITRMTVVALALLQAIAFTIMLGNLGAISYNEGWEAMFARVVIVATFMAGAMFLVFLGEQIDQKGIGNGISMILFTGIVSRGFSTVATLWGYIELALEGAYWYFVAVPLVIVLFLGVIAFIIVMTNAERKIPVQYAKKVVGRKMYGGQSTYIPIKVNMSGVLPVIFASTLLAIPSTMMGFFDPAGESTMAGILSIFNYDSVWYAIIYFMLIIAFNYFYVSIQYNPIEISNNLRKNSGAVPGIRPGKPTSDFIARIVSKTTFMGGMFLGLIATMPIIVGGLTQMNISLGGTSMIIVVGVALDTVRQLESQMMVRHYKGFLE